MSVLNRVYNTTSLGCMPMAVSRSSLYEMIKKLFLFIQSVAKIQYASVSVSDEKIPEAPCMSITEALMTVTTYFPQDKQTRQILTRQTNMDTN